MMAAGQAIWTTRRLVHVMIRLSPPSLEARFESHLVQEHSPSFTVVSTSVHRQNDT